MKTLDASGRPVYSGKNVGAAAQMVDGMGREIGRRGGVSVVPGMSQQQINATLTNPDGSRWSTADNAIMAANLRDGVDPYRGTSRAQGGAQVSVVGADGAFGIRRDPRIAADSRAGVARLQQALGQDPASRNRAADRLAKTEETALKRRELGLKEAESADARRASAVTLRSAERLARLQDQYEAAAPQDRARIAEQIRALQGKSTDGKDRFMAVGGGQTWDPQAGAVVNVPQRLFDTVTQQYVDGATAAPAATPPDGAVAMLKKDPKLAAQFDQKYGQGASARYLNK